MIQVPAWRDADGSWWIGTPNAWRIAPVGQRNRAPPLAADFAGLGITRAELFSEPEQLRETFDAEYGQ